MIPISCPQCGRSGNVPPDRLGSRLVCKGCQSVFHMDSGGRMVLGAPGAPAARSKSAKAGPSAAVIDFDLAQTWQDIPKPAKFAVPSMVVLLAGWMFFPTSTSLEYERQAEVVGQALLNGNRSKVVSLATAATSGAAEKWYDLIHTSMAEKGTASSGNSAIMAALLSGNPEQDSALSITVVINADTIATNFNLQMVKDGGAWRFDASKSLEEAERAPATIKRAKKK